jgi:hypothetical protein
MTDRRSVLRLLLGALATGGCGYSLRPSLPAGIRRVHVPTLVNRTQEPGIEDFLTQALTTAVVTSGLVQLTVPEQADAVLEGSIVEYALTGLAYNQQANVTAYRLTVGLSLVLRNLRTKEVVWRQDRISERADFQVAGQVTTTIALENLAVRRAAVDVSRAIVSLAFEGF